MAYNGTGVFSRVYNWVVDAAGNLFIDATRMDTDTDDIADGLTNCVTRDGQSPWYGDLPAGGFKLTGLGVGAAATDSVNYGQVFNNPTFTAPRVAANPPASDSSDLIPSTSWVLDEILTGNLPGQPGTVTPAYLRSISNVVTWGDNGVTGAAIASMANVNLTTASGDYLHITGTNPITSITIPDGAERTVVFDGVLTLTHNAVTLILPTGASITTAAGDTAIIRGEGGNARVVSYQRASGNPLIIPPSPNYVLLATITPTASAAVDFLNVFSSTYDNYEVFIDGVLPAVSDVLRLRAAVAGVVDTTLANYTTGGVNSWIIIPGTTVNTLAGGMGISVAMKVLNVNSTTTGKIFARQGMSQRDAAPTYDSIAISGGFVGASAISGFRLFWAGGSNFAAVGKIRVYGIANV